jgi:hypothetical protein
MSTIKTAYGGSYTAITITLTSLTNNSQRQSTAVDNTSNLYLDALVFLQIKSAASGPAAGNSVNVYAYGSVDGGATYGDTVTGTDGSVTLTIPPNLRLIGVMNMVATSTTYQAGPFSVAAAFGGVLPAKWGIVVENKSAGTFDGTTASAYYQGIQATVA